MKRTNVMMMLALLVSLASAQDGNSGVLPVPVNQNRAAWFNGTSQYYSVTPASGTMDLNGSERLANPTFDANVTGWTGTVGMTLTHNTNANRVRTGAGSAVVRSDGSANGLFISSSGGSIITDATTNKQTWEVWVYLPTTNASDSVRASIFNQAASAIASSAIVEPTKGTWTKLVVNTQLPGTQTGLRVGVYYVNPVAGDSLYADDASLTQAWDVIAYAVFQKKNTGADGGLIGCKTGTANLSGYYLYSASSNQITGKVSDGDASVTISNTTTVSANQTYVAVWTLNKTGNGVGYLNNVSTGSSSLLGLGKIICPTTLYLGGIAIGFISPLNGWIGEILFIRGTWSAPELAAIATQLSVTKKPKAGYPGQVSGGYWTDWTAKGADKFHIQPPLTATGGPSIIDAAYK